MPDLRSPARIRGLWLVDAEFEEHRFVALVALLRAAGECMAQRWPRIYLPSTDLTIVLPKGARATEALTSAARKLGCAVIEIVGAPDALAAQCDVVIAASLGLAAGLARTPLLAPSGAANFLLDPGDADPISNARARTAPKPACAEALAEALLAPPRGAQAHKFAAYLAENDDARIGRVSYDIFLRAVGARRRRDANEAPAADEWREALDAARSVRPDVVGGIETLHAAYLRADRQALAYGERWRSTLVARSLMLAFTSVFSGLVGALFPSVSMITIPIQVVSTAFVFIDGRYAARHRWREKWLDYRRLAERLRMSRFLALAGVAAPGAGGVDWVDWAAHDATRAAPPYGAIGDAEAPSVLAHLVACEIDGQIAYHRAAFRRFRRLDRQVRRAAAFALFAMMAIGASLAGAAYLSTGRLHLSLTAAISLALSAAPTLYTSLNGVRRDLDVARQARRSAEISVGLKRLTRAIADAPQTAETTRNAACRAAEIMGNDVSRWRGVVELI